MSAIRYDLAPKLEGIEAGGIARVVYDFATHGGAIGTITLPLELPSGAIVWTAVANTVVAPVGSGASISAGFNTTTDIIAATAVADWSTLEPLIPVGTAATAVRLTADRDFRVAISGGALTAGRIGFYFLYFIGE